MSDKNQDHWPEDTLFEQKLAAHKPRLLRDVKQAVVREMQEEMPSPMQHVLQMWQTFEQKMRPYLLVGACCFLLGALVMYGLMTCFFDRGPTRSGPLLAAKPSQTQTVYTMPLTMHDLDGVQTPADLTRRLRQKPVVVIDHNTTPIDPPYTQRNILRAFDDISQI